MITSYNQQDKHPILPEHLKLIIDNLDDLSFKFKVELGSTKDQSYCHKNP